MTQRFTPWNNEKFKIGYVAEVLGPLAKKYEVDSEAVLATLHLAKSVVAGNVVSDGDCLEVLNRLSRESYRGRPKLCANTGPGIVLDTGPDIRSGAAVLISLIRDAMTISRGYRPEFAPYSENAALGSFLDELDSLTEAKWRYLDAGGDPSDGERRAAFFAVWVIDREAAYELIRKE